MTGHPTPTHRSIWSRSTFKLCKYSIPHQRQWSMSDFEIEVKIWISLADFQGQCPPIWKHWRNTIFLSIHNKLTLKKYFLDHFLLTQKWCVCACVRLFVRVCESQTVHLWVALLESSHSGRKVKREINDFFVSSADEMETDGIYRQSSVYMGIFRNASTPPFL